MSIFNVGCNLFVAYIYTVVIFSSCVVICYSAINA